VLLKHKNNISYRSKNPRFGSKREKKAQAVVSAAV